MCNFCNKIKTLSKDCYTIIQSHWDITISARLDIHKGLLVEVESDKDITTSELYYCPLCGRKLIELLK